MGKPKTTAVPDTEFRVADGPDLGPHIDEFEWTSFVNRGYQVKAVVRDPFFNLLNNVIIDAEGENYVKYLKEGRKKILEVKFKIMSGGNSTDEHVAYLTDMLSTGEGANAVVTFIGIDPLSFLLNRGNADGDSYEGNVGTVIEQIVRKYGDPPRGPGVTVEVSKTKDNEKKRWFAYRQDPKTLIRSLLDWSSSATQGRSRWIVSSGWDADEKRPKVNIKEEADLDGEDLGIYTVQTNSLLAKDVKEWRLSMNNFTTAFQARMVTSSISAISGQFIDVISEEEGAKVDDANTASKVNVFQADSSEGSERAFSKPDEVDWGTYVMAVPEFSAGDLGIKYADYIDGRARQKFMNMLGVSMNLVVRVDGDYLVQNSEKLGVSTCTLHWEDADGEFYFLHGRWIVNGFKHLLATDAGWYTHLHLYRIDHDAASKKI